MMYVYYHSLRNLLFFCVCVDDLPGFLFDADEHNDEYKFLAHVSHFF